MKKLTPILLALLLISCSVSNDQEAPPPFEPQIFGNWYVDSPTHAQLKGQPEAKKYIHYSRGDTILVVSPKNYNMEIITGEGVAPGARFYDSTFVYPEGLDIQETTSSASGKVQLEHIGQMFNPACYAVVFEISYHPNASPTDDYIYLTTRFSDGTPYITYKVYVAGMDSAVRYLFQYR